MLKKDKKLKQVVNSTVSGAALDIIDELDRNDVSVEEFSGSDFFKISDDEKVPLKIQKNPVNESENLEFITNHLAEKQDIPGASLTNDPEKPYPWEQPPQFPVAQDALDDIYLTLSEPAVAKDVVSALTQGVSVMDLTSSVSYTHLTLPTILLV